jgi:putative transposase
VREGNKTKPAEALGISRSQLYYVSGKDKEDRVIKTRIEGILREFHCYGSGRIADALKLNRKRIQRIMRKFGIKVRRRRTAKKQRKSKVYSIYANLLSTTIPSYPHHVRAADFTEVWFQGRWIYIATVIDLYSRQILGVAVSLRKGTQLTLQALYNALPHNPGPEIFHSDNGSEYDAKIFIAVLEELKILISRSFPGCPWENGYQESFYDKFKPEPGDPMRCKSLGELVAEVYKTIWRYNNSRIHSALRMPPREFAKKFALSKMNV